MNIKDFNRPIFVTRVLQNEIKYVNNYPSFDAIIMDANLANYYSNPWNQIIEKRNSGDCNFIIVDPNTAKLEHKVVVQKRTYSLLSYCPESEGLVPDDFIGVGREDYANQFAINVIDTQNTLNADILLTPYFVAKTINSPWYLVNKNLVQDSIDARESLGISSPLYATLCISVSELVEERTRNIIIQDYKSMDVDGYYILAEGLSDRSSGTLELAGLLSLVKSLSETEKPIIIGSIDGFGLFTTAYGSSGFSAGICWLESFNEQNFTLELEGRNEDAMRERFYYIPETFIKFPRDRAQLIYSNQNINGLISHTQSNYYGSRTYNPDDRARLYFLEKRFAELDELVGMSEIQIKQHLSSRLDKALEINKEIAEEDIQVRYAHLSRWKEAISRV